VCPTRAEQPLIKSLVTESVGESNRERADREQRERATLRARRLRYTRLSAETPSGRPYESLPVATLADVRELHLVNRRNVHGALRNTCASVYA